MSTTTGNHAPLSQGLGYGIVIGFGLVFAGLLSLASWIGRRALSERETVEAYMTARRSVKKGLIASAVVSSWCWAATLLNSVRITTVYGLPGLWFFAAGACVQIFAFAIVAIELKSRAPRCHTLLEVVRIRWGTSAHIVLLCFGIATQVLVSAALLLGASAAVSSITGMHTVAALFLIPTGVVLYVRDFRDDFRHYTHSFGLSRLISYTLSGGLKATFVADWIHTVVIYVILLVVMFKVMTSSEAIGSPTKLYDMLTAAADTYPCYGTYKGSYLTMHSEEGLIFAGVVLVSGFASVFVDPAYGQKALAATPSAVVSGYFIGGATWFAIPLGLSGTIAFAAVVLQDTSYWPQPGGITTYVSNNGLILPLTAQALMGSGGAAAILLMVFMAVTSSSSAEYIALSSVLTYDVYRPYLRPQATDRELLFIGHSCVIGFAIFSSCFATGLYYADLSMAWLLEFLGVVISPAVIPLAGSLMSSKMSRTTAMYSPLLGLAAALAAWLGVTKHVYGSISVDTTFGDWPMFSGAVTGIFVPWLWHLVARFAPGLSAPKYDWSRLLRMDAIQPRVGDEVFALEKVDDLGHFDRDALRRASRTARWVTIVLALVFLILIPLPMYGTKYIFPKSGFVAFVVIEFIWGWIATLTITILPVWESRDQLAAIFRGLLTFRSTTTATKYNSNSDSPSELSAEDTKEPIPEVYESETLGNGDGVEGVTEKGDSTHGVMATHLP